MSLRNLVVIGILFAAYWFGYRGGCGTRNAVACPPAELEEGVAATLSVAEVCPNAGYLCAGRRAFRVERWPLTQGQLRVRVPDPGIEDRELSQKVRDAAVEGIMAWDGHPFPIVVVTGRMVFKPWDIGIRWSEGLSGGKLGHAMRNVYPDGKRMRFSVEEIRLATAPPIGGQAGAVLSIGPQGIRVRDASEDNLLARVRAIAMHEFGHALGLDHSDNKRDIMYARMEDSTGAGLDISERDLATVDALYRLPNGARVE